MLSRRENSSNEAEIRQKKIRKPAPILMSDHKLKEVSYLERLLGL